MSSTLTHRRWLEALTDLPTASGVEDAVVTWVESWAEKRNHRVIRDDAGNLVLRRRGRSRRRPVVAVAHMDHPALVVTGEGSGEIEAELRGGVHAQYLEGAAVEIGPLVGRVSSFDSASKHATISVRGSVLAGAIARWRFDPAAIGVVEGILAARACDDLAGVAAALAAFDVAAERGVNHLSVLLTRAEEVGLVGAIAACKLGTIPDEARVLSIECSRESGEAPIGAGPVVRVGDASSVFSAELSNRLSAMARTAGIPHQRKLMAGGSCEATAFCAYGYKASGLCIPLGNYHNMMDIDGVLAGRRKARLGPERVALSDFHGLVELLVVSAEMLDGKSSPLRQQLEDLYASERRVLAPAHPA